MRYRLAILCLAVVLGVLPGLNSTLAVPAPKQPKRAKIYALVYAGLAKNDPDNADRIDLAIRGLRNSALGAVRDPKVNALPIVQEQERNLGWIKRDDWAESKTRAINLEGTAVVRVWFTDGSPQEQVLIVNAIARDYVKDEQNRFRGALEQLEGRKKFYIKSIVKRPLNSEEERTFRRQEWAIKHLPFVIEYATLPEKP